MNAFAQNQYDPATIATANGTATSSTADVALVAAQGVKTRILAAYLMIVNRSSTFTVVVLKSATNAKLYIPCPPTGGAVMMLPIPFQCAENEGLNFATEDSVNSVTVSVGYAIAPKL